MYTAFFLCDNCYCLLKFSFSVFSFRLAGCHFHHKCFVVVVVVSLYVDYQLLIAGCASLLSVESGNGLSAISLFADIYDTLIINKLQYFVILRPPLVFSLG